MFFLDTVLKVKLYIITEEEQMLKWLSIKMKRNLVATG